MKIIQQARKEDYEMIKELRNEFHNELRQYGEHHEFSVISFEEFIVAASPTYILAKNDEGYEFFKIYDDEMIIGYFYITKYSGYITLQEVFIRPEYRGKRYCVTIIEMLKMYAKNVQNISEIFLAVDEKNDRAYQIYLKAGFERVYFDDERNLICMNLKF